MLKCSFVSVSAKDENISEFIKNNNKDNIIAASQAASFLDSILYVLSNEEKQKISIGFKLINSIVHDVLSLKLKNISKEITERYKACH